MPLALPGFYCLHCRYPLDGLPDRRCPECGGEFDPNDPATFADRPTRPRTPAVLAAAGAVVACGLVAALALGRSLLAVWGVYVVLVLAEWALLVAFGVWLWRRLRPRTLPWLAAYWVLRTAGGIATPFLIRLALDIHRKLPPFGWSWGETLSVLGVVGGLITQAGNLLVALAVLSEVAYLITKGAPAGRMLRLLLRVREKPVVFGVALLALAVAQVGLVVVLTVL